MYTTIAFAIRFVFSYQLRLMMLVRGKKSESDFQPRKFYRAFQLVLISISNVRGQDEWSIIHLAGAPAQRNSTISLIWMIIIINHNVFCSGLPITRIFMITHPRICCCHFSLPSFKSREMFKLLTGWKRLWCWQMLLRWTTARGLSDDGERKWWERLLFMSVWWCRCCQVSAPVVLVVEMK